MTRKLTRQQIAACIAEMEQVSAGGDTPAWRELHSRQAAIRVDVTLPQGELLNPDIAGFWYAWSLLYDGSFVWRVDQQAGLEMQGIEVVTTIETDLVTALLVASFVGPERLAIVKQRSQETPA